MLSWPHIATQSLEIVGVLATRSSSASLLRFLKRSLPSWPQARPTCKTSRLDYASSKIQCFGNRDSLKTLKAAFNLPELNQLPIPRTTCCSGSLPGNLTNVFRSSAVRL
jgi:hypothetical protein